MDESIQPAAIMKQTDFAALIRTLGVSHALDALFADDPLAFNPEDARVDRIMVYNDSTPQTEWPPKTVYVVERHEDPETPWAPGDRVTVTRIP